MKYGTKKQYNHTVYPIVNVKLLDGYTEYSTWKGINTLRTMYVDGYLKLIKENMNLIPALQVICNGPKDLTRVLASKPEDAFLEEPFVSSGGYKMLKREFGDDIDTIVYAINDYLYSS